MKPVDVNGSHAYVVVPASVAFTVGGMRVTQSESVFTLGQEDRVLGCQIEPWAKGTQ